MRVRLAVALLALALAGCRTTAPDPTVTPTTTVQPKVGTTSYSYQTKQTTTKVYEPYDVNEPGTTLSTGDYVTPLTGTTRPI